MRRFVFVCSVAAVVLFAPVAAEGVQDSRAGQNVTLFATKAGQRGEDEVMLPDECASVTVALKAPKASVGMKSEASVTTDSGRVLHAFGKITRMTSSWQFSPSGNFDVSTGLFEDPPPYRLSATCLLTTRGANEWNSLSGH